MLNKNEGKIPVFYINLLRKYSIDPAVMFRSSAVKASARRYCSDSRGPVGPEDDPAFASLAPPSARPVTLDPKCLVGTDVRRNPAATSPRPKPPVSDSAPEQGCSIHSGRRADQSDLDARAKQRVIDYARTHCSNYRVCVQAGRPNPCRIGMAA